jgi:methyl-accepting chemotaxis protein
MSELADEQLRRRAFQLAHLSEELALMSEQLADQARSIAEAAAAVAQTSEELITPIGGASRPPEDEERREE